MRAAEGGKASSVGGAGLPRSVVGNVPL